MIRPRAGGLAFIMSTPYSGVNISFNFMKCFCLIWNDAICMMQSDLNLVNSKHRQDKPDLTIDLVEYAFAEQSILFERVHVYSSLETVRNTYISKRDLYHFCWARLQLVYVYQYLTGCLSKGKICSCKLIYDQSWFYSMFLKLNAL